MEKVKLLIGLLFVGLFGSPILVDAQEDVGYSYAEPAPQRAEEPSTPPPPEENYAPPVVDDYSPPPNYDSSGSDSGDF